MSDWGETSDIAAVIDNIKGMCYQIKYVRFKFSPKSVELELTYQEAGEVKHLILDRDHK